MCVCVCVFRFFIGEDHPNNEYPDESDDDDELDDQQSHIVTHLSGMYNVCVCALLCIHI